MTIAAAHPAETRQQECRCSGECGCEDGAVELALLLREPAERVVSRDAWPAGQAQQGARQPAGQAALGAPLDESLGVAPFWLSPSGPDAMPCAWVAESAFGAVSPSLLLF